MNKTSIEWTDYTWNPITGCTKGCEYCYAHKLANGRLKSKYLANTNLPRHDEKDHKKHHEDPFYPRFWDSRLLELQNAPLNCKVFVCDMSDLFADEIPKEWFDLVMFEIKCCDDITCQLLTKRPWNLPKHNPYPENCWVGMSCTNMSQIGDLQIFGDVQAKVKFASFEPMLDYTKPDLRYVDWVIIGGQTKPTKFPQIEWVADLVKECDKFRIPVFLKNNLRRIIPEQESLFNKAPHILRQEYPK